MKGVFLFLPLLRSWAEFAPNPWHLGKKVPGLLDHTTYSTLSIYGSLQKRLFIFIFKYIGIANWNHGQITMYCSYVLCVPALRALVLSTRPTLPMDAAAAPPPSIYPTSIMFRAKKGETSWVGWLPGWLISHPLLNYVHACERKKGIVLVFPGPFCYERGRHTRARAC